MFSNENELFSDEMLFLLRYSLKLNTNLSESSYVIVRNDLNEFGINLSFKIVFG